MPLLPAATLFPYTTLFRSQLYALHRGGPMRNASIVLIVAFSAACGRSEEHTSELQSHSDLVCRLLLEKKKASADGQQSIRRDRTRRYRSAAPSVPYPACRR